MKKIVLYLDKMSAPMEKVLLDFCPDDLTIKFLNPVQGEKGTIAEASYVLATNFLVTKDVIDQAPLLKMIQRTGVGYDNVDVVYAKAKQIPVSITLGSNASSVAELTIGLMISLLRNLAVLNKKAKEGKWETWTYRHESYEILGKIVGFVGAGTIGKAIMERLAPFGAKMIYTDTRRLPEETEEKLGITYCELPDLLANSDIVTLHVPWLESTRGLIGATELGLMKKTAFLINTARGPVVDQKALVQALRNGELAGAGLDVFDPEPFTADSEILHFDNVITTPHIGAATVDNFKRVFKYCMENIQKVERGEPPMNVVNQW